MKKKDWGVEITKVDNGFLIVDNEGKRTVVEEKEDDELSAGEKLLWEIIHFFNLRPSRHERECIRVVREVGDKYTPREGEKIVKEYFFKVFKVKGANSKKPERKSK